MNGKRVDCSIRGNLKLIDKLLVGDFCEMQKNEYDSNNFIITSINKRKNVLKRPAIANLDQLFIVISIWPEPDFYLADKLIVYCLKNNIKPVLVVNKSDIMNSVDASRLVLQYSRIIRDVVLTSAVTAAGIEKLKQMLKGNFTAFAGQSAVGKSSILNIIAPDLNLKTNTLSEKISRGKHTTRLTEIFVVDDDSLVADTPGFSVLDLNDIEPIELKEYYLDFSPYFEECKFNNCDHINVPMEDCGVQRAVENGKVDKRRFARYGMLYNNLKEIWRRKYD